MSLIIEPIGFADAFPDTIRHVIRGLGTEYSCASVAVVQKNTVLLQFCTGNRQDYSGTTFLHKDPLPVNMETLYDMASVTKLLATTPVALRLLEEGALHLTDNIAHFFQDAGNFPSVTIQNLLTHTSGLTPHIPLFSVCGSPDEAIGTILHSDPLCKPGEQVYYSCMGFILLQHILETVTGEKLDSLAQKYVFAPLHMGTACYRPQTDNVAATEFSPWHKRYLCGQVHDENAYFLGGVSGNAGVFASLSDMIQFAKMLSCHGDTPQGGFLQPQTFAAAIQNYTAGLDEDRGLGFSLKIDKLSASGELTSPGTYGHNGYTGTSVYCDAQTGICMVLLTNSVHYGRDNRSPFFNNRRVFHNITLTEAKNLLLQNPSLIQEIEP